MLVIIKVKTLNKVAESVKLWVVNLLKRGKTIILDSLNETNTMCCMIRLGDIDRYVYDRNTIYV